MTPEEFVQIQEEFLQLRKLEIAQIEERLRTIGEDSETKAQLLRELLEADRTNESPLDRPLASLLSEHEDTSVSDTFVPESSVHSSSADCRTREFPSTDANDLPHMIGPYRILQMIGEGGHGVVYMAEQKSPIRRKVALKLIKPGMESKVILARFEAERQALALMKHPSIANVIDAGTSDSGSPYFVMELVHGIQIDRFCRENELTLQETLQLFQQVCDAVHHAHRKGIIHRDIKPANILVTVDSGKPLAKVIDFGIAKAMHLTLTDKTMFTEYGQIVGTLEYMSPEQATMSQDEADVRSDVYSLGVLLYVLLTGCTPISRQQLLEKGLFELKNVLRDYRPPTPSLRLTGNNNAKSWRGHSDADLKVWLNKLKGDLDWITMKALAKDLNQRFDSVAAFSDDIQSFLNGDKVLARPPSLLYTASKWIRKNRVAATVIGSIVTSIVICFAAVSWGLVKSQQNLADVKAAERLLSEKALALESSLQQTDRQRHRADANARRMALILKQKILQSAWEKALDGDSQNSHDQLTQIAQPDRDYMWRFVDSVRRQMDWPSLRNEERGPIRLLSVHEQTGQIAIVTTDSRLEIWNLADRSIVHEKQLAQALYGCLEFSTDGNSILLGASDWVQFYDLKQGTQSEKLVHGKGGTRAAIQLPQQDTWLLTTGANFMLKVDSLRLSVTQKSQLPERIGKLKLSPSQNKVAVAALSGNVFIVDVSDLKMAGKITGVASPIKDMNWNRNRLDVVGSYGSLFTFNLPVNQESDGNAWAFKKNSKPSSLEKRNTEFILFDDSHQLAANRDGTVSLFSHDGTLIPLRQFSPAITRLIASRQQEVVVVQHFNGRVNLISYQDIKCRQNYAGQFLNLADGVSLANEFASITAHQDGKIQRWQTQTGELTGSSQIHSDQILSIDVSESTGKIASFGTDWSIQLSDLETLSSTESIPAAMGVRQIVFSDSGLLLAGAPDRSNKSDLREGTIDVWNVEDSRSIVRLVGHDNWVSQLAFFGNDANLISLGLDGTIRTWEVGTGKLLLTIDLSNESPASQFAVFESQKQIAIGHRDGSLSLRSLDDGDLVTRRHLLANSIGNMIAPKGSNSLFVSADNQPFLTLLDSRNLATIAELDAGTGNIIGMRTDKQSKRLQILGESGVARIWELPE